MCSDGRRLPPPLDPDLVLMHPGVGQLVRVFTPSNKTAVMLNLFQHPPINTDGGSGDGVDPDPKGNRR